MPKVPDVDFNTVPSLSVAVEPTPKIDYGGELFTALGKETQQISQEVKRRTEQTDAINSSMMMDEYFNSTVPKKYSELIQKVKSNPNMSQADIEAEFANNIANPLQKERERLSSLSSNPQLSALEINKSLTTKAGRLQRRLQTDVMKVKVDSARKSVKLSIESNTAGAKAGTINATDLAIFRDRLYGRVDQKSGQLVGGMADSIGLAEAIKSERDHYIKTVNGRIDSIDDDSSPAAVQEVKDMIAYGRDVIKVPEELTALANQNLEAALEGAQENDYNDLKSGLVRITEEFNKGPARESAVGEFATLTDRLKKSSFRPSQAREMKALSLQALNAAKISIEKAMIAKAKKFHREKVRSPMSEPTKAISYNFNDAEVIDISRELIKHFEMGDANKKSLEQNKSIPLYWDNKGGTSGTGLLHRASELVDKGDAAALSEFHNKIDKRFRQRPKSVNRRGELYAPNYRMLDYLTDEYRAKYANKGAKFLSSNLAEKPTLVDDRPSFQKFVEEETGMRQNSRGQWVGEPKGIYATKMHVQGHPEKVYSLGNMWLNGLTSADEIDGLDTAIKVRLNEARNFFMAKTKGKLDINKVPLELSSAMLSTWFQDGGAFFKYSSVRDGAFGMHLESTDTKNKNVYNKRFHEAVEIAEKTGNFNPLTQVFLDAVKDKMKAKGMKKPNRYQKRRIDEYKRAIKAEDKIVPVEVSEPLAAASRGIAGDFYPEESIQETYNALAQHPDFADIITVDEVRADYRRREKELQIRYNNQLVEQLNGADPSLKPQLESGDPAIINRAKQKIVDAAINLNLDSSSIKFLTEAQVKQQAALLDSYAKGGDPEGGKFYADIMTHFNNLGGYFGDKADAAVGIRQLINEGKSGEGRTVPYLSYMLPLVNDDVGRLIAAGYNNKNKIIKEEGEESLQKIVFDKFKGRFFADDSYSPRSLEQANADIGTGYKDAVLGYASGLIAAGGDKDNAIEEALKVVERETGLIKGDKIDLFGGSPSVQTSLTARFGKEMLQKTADNLDEAFAFAMMEPSTLSQFLADIPTGSDMARNIKNVMDIARVDKVEAAKAFMTTLSSDLIFDLDPDRPGNFMVYIKPTEGKPKAMMLGNAPASFPIEDAVRYTMNPRQEQFGPAVPLKGPSGQEVSRRLGSRIFFGGF